MYIILAIVATVCTIVAANIREERVQSKSTNKAILVLIGITTVSAGQIVVALTGELIGATIRGDLWQVVLHIPCIMALYVLLIVWYFKSIFQSQYAS